MVLSLKLKVLHTSQSTSKKFVTLLVLSQSSPVYINMHSLFIDNSDTTINGVVGYNQNFYGAPRWVCYLKLSL
ncbi:MAG: hypothetical protein JKX76_14210 [Colwellia sp.]|nr:hypothetical protein [Colwellia sp.]